MADTQNVVRYSPLHNVVFACIFQDEDKAGKAMLEFLNAVMQHVGGRAHRTDYQHDERIFDYGGRAPIRNTVGWMCG